MAKFVQILFLVTCLISCNTNKTLESVLKLAGDNRVELEKVLDHYREDNIKLKAAIFLIENMPGHYSYKDTAYVALYYNTLDSIFTLTDDKTKDSLFKQLKERHSTSGLEIIKDIEIIEADFLIKNIDDAFSVWQARSFNQDLNFDEFCEYLLPYKVAETQAFEPRDKYFAEKELDKLNYCQLFKDSRLKACELVNHELQNTVKPRLSTENSLPIEVRSKMNLDSQIPIRRMSTLFKIPYGTCDDYSDLAADMMRAKGIPVAVDFTPQWPFRSLGHSWNVLVDRSRKNIVFEGCNGRPGMPHKEDHIMAKVYRRTYSINKEIEDINKTDTYVPDITRNVFVKDVTEEYMPTVDIKIRVSDYKKSDYSYLAVFDNINWVPVCWGKNNSGKALFNKVGKGIAYLPVSFGNRGMRAIADPIIISYNGEITNLKPDTVNKQTMVLYRKYPAFPHVYEIMDRVIGGQIQASDNPEFNNSVVFHTIQKYGVTAEDLVLNNEKKYRYWRYFSPEGKNCNIAELNFYEKDSISPHVGEIIGTSGSFWHDGRNEKESVFDGDALTFFDSPWGDSWVGMDFGKPVAIDRVYYLSRNDGNCIEIGDDYELVYWGDNRWKSLGRQKAEKAYLTFPDCPLGALYLLHNHTKGREERIFTYEDGKQVWW